ncbi:hypothetical protein HELRODRAFT_168564 [Helobdella robusta]|uniref:Serine/threonine-protein kinase D1-3-like ubiquitin-like domain-containing protein n=1 Tax=Helobdella robusta TaxID=6412 RepID=T1F0Q7_HELRO|nr:hypothetical protein HELRODRAFT_168564 [Helobdella robusta]ESO09562.1 hypothetical protein HELRODRAFT_168564 [Helobdella robusta]
MDKMLNLSEKDSASVTALQQTKNKCWNISFQTGLVRKSIRINLDSNGELSMENLKRAACVFIDENFPEHGFCNLTDKILLFKHDLSDINILKMINNVSDLVEKALIEVVLSG